MTTATGVVQGVYSKDVTTRFGNKKVWDIKLDDGNYYKNGFKKPIVDVGDSVTIEFTPDKYGNAISSLIRGGSSTAAPAKAGENMGEQPNQRSQTYNNKGNKPFPIPSDHGDRSIIRQNSLTNARELVGVIYSVDNEVNGLDTPEDLADLIIKIAYKFEEYSSGDREVKAVDSLMEANAATKVKKPKKVKAEDDKNDYDNL